MKFSAVLLGLAAVDGILAAKFTEKRRESRAARRAQREHSVRGSEHALRRGQPMIQSVNKTEEYHVDYSTNWAGAVLIGTGYTGVTGTVIAPTLPSSSGSTQKAGTAWVGIDGDTCSTAILQTGIDWYVEGSTVSYDAWYEWYPDYSYDFTGITINEGDTIVMTVKATSKTSGSATIENLTTGVTKTETFTGVTDGSLCEYNAEWIVEDFEECTGSSCSLVPFADFGTVEFTGCSATKSGSTVGVTGATIIDLRQNGNVLVTCTDTSSTVTCKYQ